MLLFDYRTPKFYGLKLQRKMIAGAQCEDLRARCAYFYDVACLLHDITRSDDLCTFVNNTFRARYKACPGYFYYCLMRIYACKFGNLECRICNSLSSEVVGGSVGSPYVAKADHLRLCCRNGDYSNSIAFPPHVSVIVHCLTQVHVTDNTAVMQSESAHVCHGALYLVLHSCLHMFYDAGSKAPDLTMLPCFTVVVDRFAYVAGSCLLSNAQELLTKAHSTSMHETTRLQSLMSAEELALFEAGRQSIDAYDRWRGTRSSANPALASKRRCTRPQPTGSGQASRR